jgi:hypothetical protein
MLGHRIEKTSIQLDERAAVSGGVGSPMGELPVRDGLERGKIPGTFLLKLWDK